MGEAYRFIITMLSGRVHTSRWSDRDDPFDPEAPVQAFAMMKDMHNDPVNSPFMRTFKKVLADETGTLHLETDRGVVIAASNKIETVMLQAAHEEDLDAP